NLGAAFSDLDMVQSLPLLAWALVLGLAFKRVPDRIVGFAKDPLVSFVMLTLVVHTVAVALIFGTETGDDHSLLRYMPHLIVFGSVPLYILIAKLVKNMRLFVAICVAVAGTNLLSISYWHSNAGKDVPVSWWPATYQEIFQPQPEVVDAVMNAMRLQKSANPDAMETLLVIPSWLQEVAIFYLGDHFIVVPQIDPGSTEEKIVRAKIGNGALSKFKVVPHWVLHEASQAPVSVPGYERIQIPVHRRRPDDGTRPELTRHTFYQQREVGFISLYKRLE
ncbi:MAG: hypothetical protein ABIZ09_00640, partial [Rhodoferax sp.]